MRKKEPVKVRCKTCKHKWIAYYAPIETELAEHLQSRY
jgi:hypothetical protein